MKISVRERVLMLILVVAVLGAGYYYFYWQSAYAEINGMREEVRAREAELDILTANIMTWSSLKAESEKNAEAWEFLDAAIPERFNQSAVIKAMENITSQYAEDVSMTFEEVDDSFASVIIHPVTVKLTASYDNIAAMLKVFLSQGTACRITKLELQEINASTGNYNALFVIEYPEKMPPPA